MARLRSSKPYTDEEKRKLKIDIKRIPEWEAEIEALSQNAKKFNLREIYNSANYIFEILNKLDIYPRNEYNRVEVVVEQKKLNTWLEQLTNNNLLEMTERPLPAFMQSFTSHLGIISNIETNIIRISKGLAEAKSNGVTKSLLIETFTSKVSMQRVENLLAERKKYLPIADEIPKIEAAIKLLDEARTASIEYCRQRKQIYSRLELAKIKKDAIDRYEKKNENAFAKAAAADKKTRSRAKSLKRLVEMTEHCPYCGNALGSDPHLDHIYPVSKGGLSIVENLVWCCSVCNASKTDKGLMQFLKDRDFPIERVLSKLHDLGKHV